MKVILLAGGGAKRLVHVMGEERSRALLRFPKGSLLEKHLMQLKRVVDEVYVVSDDDQINDVCKKMPECRFVSQTHSGIEGAICNGLNAAYPYDSVEENVTILYGDLYYSQGFIESHLSRITSSYEPTITVTKPHLLRGQYLRTEVDPISGIVEALGRGSYIFAGLMTMPVGEIRSSLCKKGETIEAMLHRLARESRLTAIMWMGEWIDIDTPWDYLVAVRLDMSKLSNTYISQTSKIGRGVVIEGPVYIDDEAQIDHHAVIKGPAYIGPRTLIGAHAFIRNSVAVFDNAIVGAYCEIKRSIIYSRARIGSHSYIADSLVGKEAKVSPYTITKNVPYKGVSKEIIIMSTHPLEGLKVGALISAKAETKPHQTLEPATVLNPQA
ncbi:MAG: hypothetical protein DSY37_00880 [Hyperthermus sp.]|nr:MAG: hypothetical protein DSY37_00880 [Hyperthermus sp.]